MEPKKDSPEALATYRKMERERDAAYEELEAVVHPKLFGNRSRTTQC